MAARGLHLALSAAERDALLAAPDDAALLALLGGRPLADDARVVLRLIEPEEVAALAAAMAPLDRVQLLVRFLRRAENDSPAYGEEAFERAWVSFQYLRDFFTRAAARGQAAVFALAE